ncbi:hypothetical protein [Arthrobacter sp. B0490]|uniref:hypothetical protein n=1 Tax=Arthrobacter sp. B0490 TaxID=2058891 RepID=UPI000CE2BEFE|nr:hypothetical protein [Arthrobacter sp. B0490]
MHGCRETRKSALSATVLPADAPEDVEGPRTRLAEAPVTSALATVSDPEGGLTLALEIITVATPEGQDLELRPASTVIEEWAAAAAGGESPEVVGLVEQYAGGAVPGGTSELLMLGAFSDLPDTARTVTVRPTGGEEPVEATVRPESRPGVRPLAARAPE